jgi:hypothetical protein
LGNDVIPRMPIDRVFLVGEPTDYTTVDQKTGSYFPLFPASALVSPERLTALTVDEDKRRKALAEKQFAMQRQQEQETQRRERDAKDAAFAELTRQLRRTFTDSAGKNSVDAACVGLNGEDQTISLVRLSDKKQLTVPLKRLSDTDRKWVTRRLKLIQEKGPSLAEYLLAKSAH